MATALLSHIGILIAILEQVAIAILVLEDLALLGKQQSSSVASHWHRGILPTALARIWPAIIAITIRWQAEQAMGTSCLRLPLLQAIGNTWLVIVLSPVITLLLSMLRRRKDVEQVVRTQSILNLVESRVQPITVLTDNLQLQLFLLTTRLI